MGMDREFVLKRMGEKGLDRAALADRCFVVPDYMKNILNGLRPSKRVLHFMAKALECEVSELLGERDAERTSAGKR